jgi:hypothetical protein
MRGLKSFVGLVVILFGLLLYVFYVEVNRDPAGDGEKKENAFTVQSDTIEQVTIKAESGERTVVRKSGNDWQVVEPVTAPADAVEISGITTNLARVEIQRVVDENASDLEQYGLDPARIEVSYKAGAEEQRLLVGQKTPTGSDLYARVGDQKKVFLIASFLETTLNRTTFDLRDKTALEIDREKIDAIEIGTAGKTMRMAKADAEWQITAPVSARADFTAVEGLVARLANLQMKSIVEGAGDYGFDTPAATVRIGTGSSQAALAIGKPADEGSVYARDLSRDAVFTIESSVLDELKKGAGEYLQKDLFDARAFNTTRVEVKRNTQTVVFEKTQDKWRQIVPAEKDVDGAKVDALLSAITGARATEFVDSPPKGLKTELMVVLKFDEGKKQEWVEFSRAGDTAYATRGGSQGVAKVDAAAIDTIVKALEDVK